MKRAVLLHGTDGSPEDTWFPWINGALKNKGYQVYKPLLPENHTPNKDVYDDFLKNSGWNFANNVIVGHSSGATTILNLLSSSWFPSLKTIVLVGAFLDTVNVVGADWYEDGQFDNLFLPEKVENVYFVHGDDDPYCSYQTAKNMCEKMDGKFITIHNGHHLGSTSGLTRLPGLYEQLVADGAV